MGNFKMNKIATFAACASVVLADIGSDFVSTETQIKSQQAKINTQNNQLGKLRGALKVLHTNAAGLTKQISIDRAALKTITVKYNAAVAMHRRRGGRLIKQQTRLAGAKAGLQNERRNSDVLRARLLRINKTIKKATHFIKHEAKKVAKISIKTSHSVKKAMASLKKQQAKTAKIMKKTLTKK